MPPELYADLQTMSLRLFLSPCEGLSAPSVPPALHSTQMQRHEIYIFFGQEVMTKLFSESVSSLNMFTGLLNAYSLAFSLESCYPNTLKYHSALIHPAPRGSTATNGAADFHFPPQFQSLLRCLRLALPRAWKIVRGLGRRFASIAFARLPRRLRDDAGVSLSAPDARHPIAADLCVGNVRMRSVSLH